MEHAPALTRAEARLWARTGVLAAFALVLSYIETFIPLPVPVPGAKLGLANIPILVALKLENAKSAFAIAVIKTLVTGLLFGSPIMIPYSAAGTLLAFLSMWALIRVPGLHIVLVSIIGSLFHIAGQLAAATLILGTALVWYTFPLLAVVACFTGALTGWVAQKLIDALARPAEPGADDAAALANPLDTGRRAAAEPDRQPPSAAKRLADRIDARWLLAAFVAYIAVVLCMGNWPGLAACAALALAAAIAARLSIRDALKAFAPLASILVVTTIAQVLYSQHGTVVAQLGPIVVTREALDTVAFMFVRLLCIMAMSVAFVRAVPFSRVTGALNRLLAPLAKRGVRADAFVLALDLAVQFIPVLSADFERLRAQAADRDESFGTGSLLAKLRAYASLMGPLAVLSFAYADQTAAEFAAEER